MLYGDVFIGKIVKAYNPKVGFKGEMELTGDVKCYIVVGYNGQLADYLKESVNKTIVVHGDLAFPLPTSKAKVPILTVRGKVGGSGFMSKRGRLTKDAELKYSGNGKQYVQFSIAVNRGYGDNKETYYVNCTMFGNEKDKNPAVTLAEKGAKGREIIVQGRLDSNQKDGTTYYNMIVTNYEFIGVVGKKETADEPGVDPWDDIATQVNNVDEEDIPF